MRRAGILLFLFPNEFFLRADHSLGHLNKLPRTSSTLHSNLMSTGASWVQGRLRISLPSLPASQSPCWAFSLQLRTTRFFSPAVSADLCTLSTTRNLHPFPSPSMVLAPELKGSPGELSTRASSSLGHLGWNSKAFSPCHNLI